MIAPDSAQERRERRRASRRREIVDAALRIVVDEGVDALTMPKLAAKLDVAVGGLYRYFTGKDQILVALALVAVDAYGQHMARSLEALDLPPQTPPGVATLARLWAALRSWTEFSLSAPVLFRLLEAITTDARTLLDDDAVREVQDHVVPVTTLVAEAIEDAVGAEALQPGPADLRVYVVWSTLQGSSLFRKQDHRRAEHLAARYITDEAIATLLVGWGAPPDVLAEARRLGPP